MRVILLIKKLRLFFAVASLALGAASAFAQQLAIHTIDVGQGASELIIGPNGKSILIDGGTSSKGYSEVVPYLNAIFPVGSRHLNYMIASHDDSDHYGGLNAVLASGYTAETIYHCGDNSSFGKGVQIPLGLVIDLGNGARAICVGRHAQFVGGSTGSSYDNNDSVCLLVEYGVFDYVTAGDLETNEDPLSNALITYPPGSPYLDPAYGADVIHVNHHGSDGSSKYYYINRLKPELAVINGGTGYDHPRWTAVDRIKGRANYTIPCACSDRCGDATYVTWSGAAVFRTTAGDQGDCLRASLADCPVLGDMVISYNGSSAFYYLNPGGRQYAVDEPLPITPTPTRTPGPSPTPTRVPGDVMINEILAKVPLDLDGDANGDGVRNSWQDEFVELVNWTKHTINLGGCVLSDSSADRYTFASPFPLPSGKALVLFGGGTPTGDFGGAITLTASTQSYYGLSLNDTGDTVTLRNGEGIYDTVTYGQQNYTSYNRWPEIRGPFTFHNLIPEAAGRLFSPGTKVNGAPFEYEPTPTPAPSLTPFIFPTPKYVVLADGDYNGDGTSDIAVYRCGSGLWSVRGITRVYFGSSAGFPIPADYDGDGTTDIGVFKSGSGLWAIRNISRIYFGNSSDLPVPGDYDGDGLGDLGVFRETDGRWAIRGVTRVYFGAAGDVPVPGDYNGDGRTNVGIFRESTGLWSVKLPSWSPRIYFGGFGDRPAAGDYAGNGFWTAAIFRKSSGLWAIRNFTRRYFGAGFDQPVPADYDGNGADDIAIFRSTSGLWAISGISRTYFGSAGVIPVTR